MKLSELLNKLMDKYNGGSMSEAEILLYDTPLCEIHKSKYLKPVIRAFKNKKHVSTGLRPSGRNYNK